MQRILLISVCGTDRGHEPSTTSHNFWYSKQAYLLDPYRGTGSFPAVPFPQLISGGALSPCLFISTFHPRGDLQPRNILSLFAGTKGKKKVTTNRAPACPGPRMLTKAYGYASKMKKETERSSINSNTSEQSPIPLCSTSVCRSVAHTSCCVHNWSEHLKTVIYSLLGRVQPP